MSSVTQDPCATMIGRLAALSLLRTVYLIQSAGVPQEITTIETELGSDVDFSCSSLQNEDRFFHWYKQSLGYAIQTVASGVYGDIKLKEPFNETRFRVKKENNKLFLTIISVEKDDEAFYFCQSGTEYAQFFSNGSFLTIKDCNEQTAVYVKQIPDTSELRLGDTMALQCSLLSKNQETRVQCPAKHSLHWFRSGSRNFNPNIIYTHGNVTDEDEGRSCSYHLSKTLQDSSDFGTYYCAVVTCGNILFGNGTHVDAKTEMDPVILVLGGLLFCSVTVILFLIYIIQKRDLSFGKGTRRASQYPGNDESTAEHQLERETTVVNYSALNLSTRNTEHEKKKENRDCVYSSVRGDSKRL